MRSRAIEKLRDVHDETMFESLEQRLVLASSPLPTIGMLEDPTNTVVRIETNFGDIDLELFDSITPNTVDNFLGYVRAGDYDSTFFHRMIPGFVAQTGGFRFTTADTDDDGILEGTTRVPTNGNLVNEFNRSNVERTIAMAKLPGDPDSATSQWFINFEDNSANLDSQNGGFTVFGRVLGDASWAVAETIEALEARQDVVGFQDLPVADDFNGSFTEDTLVFINNVEIIKATGNVDFYRHTLYYPEGFAGSTINEFLPMGNPNNQTVHYQVIAHSEVSQPDPDDGTTDFWFRDRVIATGTIAPNSRGGITISRFDANNNGAPSIDDLVPQGVPYSIEVQTTLPVSANISHFDFGSATGEAFTGELSDTWAFAEARKGGGRFEFLVWHNPNPDDVSLTITFYIDGESPVTRTFTTDGYRRGGLAFNNFNALPDDSTFAIEVSATDDVLVSITQFDNSGSTPQGAAVIGTPGDPASRGVIPMASIGPDSDHIISVLNPGNTVAIVGLTLVFDDGRPDRELPAQLIIPTQSRGTFDLSTVAGLNDSDDFTVLYNAGSARVYAQSTHIDAFNVDGDIITDTVGQPVAISAADRILFAEGFIDPNRAGTDVFETITLYNPNYSFFGATAQAVNVDVVLYYTDGFQLTIQRTVAAGERVDLELHNLPEVLQQGTDNNRFFYSVDITATLPIVAQMIHYDLTLGDLQPSGGFATLGQALSTPVLLEDLGTT